MEIFSHRKLELKKLVLNKLFVEPVDESAGRQFIDESILDEMEQEGFFKSLRK
jgi:hypothetical protein